MFRRTGFPARPAVDDPDFPEPRLFPDEARDIPRNLSHRQVQRDRLSHPRQVDGGGRYRERATVLNLRGLALHRQRYRPGDGLADDVDPRMGLPQDLQVALPPARVRAVFQLVRNIREARPVGQLVPAHPFSGRRPQQLSLKLPPLTGVQPREILRMKRLQRELLSPVDAAPQRRAHQRIGPASRRLRPCTVPRFLPLGGQRAGRKHEKSRHSETTKSLKDVSLFLSGPLMPSPLDIAFLDSADRRGNRKCGTNSSARHRSRIVQ